MNRKQRRKLYFEGPPDRDLGYQVRTRKKTNKEIEKNVIDSTMTLLFVLPIKVLMDQYWADDPQMPEKVKEFTEIMLEYYEKWRDDELTMDEMKQDLWEYGGIRFEKG